MSKEGIEMYKLQEIVEAILSVESIKKIARRVKVSKNTVKKYKTIIDSIVSEKANEKVELAEIMKIFREKRNIEQTSENFNWLEAHLEIIKSLINDSDNYARLVEVLRDKGFKGSYSSLNRYIHKNNLNPSKPIFRIESKPGELAQVDFGYIGKIKDEISGKEIKAYIFVFVLCYSRDAYYEIVKSQDVKNWCRLHINAFKHFNGIPSIIIPDNLKSAIIKASFTQPEANKSYADLANHYGFQIDPCLPGTPEHKGKVESGVKYAKANFMAFREFQDFNDANRQLQEWNENKARQRIHGTTRQKPIELFEQLEKQALKPLPINDFEITEWKNAKVYQDIHIVCNKAYYSVPYRLCGHRVWIRISESQVTIFYENELVAVHKTTIPGGRQTKNEHYPPDVFRYMEYTSDYCIEQAEKIGLYTQKMIQHLLYSEPIRNLRAAQNIIRLKNKFQIERLENACKRSLIFGNYTYMSVKNILVKELDRQEYLLDFSLNFERKLDSTFARNIEDIINDGNEIYLF